MTRSVADLFFAPRSIVVHGASSDPDKLSGRPLDYLKRFGFAGELYAVNPRRDFVQGVPAYASIADVPRPVDLSIIVVPADKVPDAVEQSAAAGVKAVTIFASGFSEAPDGVGVEAQERIALACRRTGMRVLGPNGLGSFSLPVKAFATFSTAFDVAGDVPDSPIALVSQSGAVGTFTYSSMTAVGLGVRYFANTGNEVDVSVVEMLDALVDRDDVDVLLGHLEAFREPAALERLAARAAEADKPLVLLKAGRTPVGDRAIGFHTGSRGGDDDEFNATLARHGGIRAQSMEEMVDLALVFAPGRRTRGRRVTVVTQSGGAGALTSDIACDVGLEVEPWSDASARAKVAELLPFFASTANPIDLTGALINDVSILDKTLQVAAENEETDVVLVVLGNSDKAAKDLVEVCVRHHRATEKPFVVVWTGGSGQPRLDLLAAGVPTYAEPARATRALGHLVEHSLRSVGVGA